MKKNIHYHPSNDTYSTGVPTPTKKKSGCGCFLLGCLGLIALIFIPVIGGGIYLASMDHSQWGSKIVSVILDPTYSEQIKNAILNNSDMDPQQKQALAMLYDKFQTNYNTLPAEQQQAINKNIFVVIKKLMTNPESFNEKPPQELLDIMNTLQISQDTAQLKSIIEKTPTQTPPPSGQTNSSPDPYDFNIDELNKPVVAPTPTQNTQKPTTGTGHKTEYDF